MQICFSGRLLEKFGNLSGLGGAQPGINSAKEYVELLYLFVGNIIIILAYVVDVYSDS